GRIVRAAASLVDEGPFDVDAGDTGDMRRDRLPHGLDGAGDDGEVFADERGKESGRAEAPVGGADGPDRRNARVIVEERAAAAVHLAIDEAGHEVRAAQVFALRAVDARVRSRHDIDDASAVHE